MRNDRLRALDAIELLHSFAQQGRDRFFEDLLVQSAILRPQVLLGEACRNLSPEIRATRQDAPWAQIIAFRNVVVHEYFGIDLALVWEIVSNQLDPLRNALVQIHAGLD
jgi:uncharacterized protein with HEPN domain